MERARRKDSMDGGIAQQRARDLLAGVRREVENVTHPFDVEHDISWARHTGTCAEYLRGAYAEGYAEGLAQEDQETVRTKVMHDTCANLREYMSRYVDKENVTTQKVLLNRVVAKLDNEFVLTLRDGTDLSREKQDALLMAFGQRMTRLLAAAASEEFTQG